MKAILCIAVGFWIGRQIYLKHDKPLLASRLNRTRARLRDHFIKTGLTREQATRKADKLIRP